MISCIVRHKQREKSTTQPPPLPTAPFFFFFFPFYTLHTVKVAVRKYKAEVSVQPHHKQRAAAKKKETTNSEKRIFSCHKIRVLRSFWFYTLGELERDNECVCVRAKERER